MRAPISVVIPVLNGAEALPGCAAALLEGVEAGLIREMIVSDGGSSDGSCAVADALGAQWITGDASRGGQLRRGCAQARGAWLLVVHADTQLSPGWSDAVQRHLARSDAGNFQLAFDGGGFAARFVAGWANLRSRLFGLPYGDQGILVPRALYEAAGGYADIPLMEDVALARALRGQLRGLEAVAVTSADKYRRGGWLRRGARNLWTLLRYFAGAAPEDLARSYRKR
jgi:rSAM/selenodomain-associated transferase 2